MEHQEERKEEHQNQAQPRVSLIKRRLTRKLTSHPVRVEPEVDETIVSVKKNSKTTKLELKNSIPEGFGNFINNLFTRKD